MKVLNKQTLKKPHMYFVVSYWDSSAQKFCMQYLNSKFPMYCSVEVLQSCLDNALKELDLIKMIQLSMDNCARQFVTIQKHWSIKTRKMFALTYKYW